MSAILGIVRFDGGAGPLDYAEKMTTRLEKYGPDGSRHWSAPGIALGHCVMCTTPEAAEEVQPLEGSDGRFVLVFDGRVDNWEELRAELVQTGAGLRSRSDAELVIQSFMVWGPDCLDHIDGDFALAIWDNKLRTLFCARDRFGVRPFYYHFDSRVFSFASEVRSLLDLPWTPWTLNEGYVAEWLGGEVVSDDETFWLGVMKLPPSRWLQLSIEGLKVGAYWQPDLTPFAEGKGDADYQSEYRTLLWDAVRRQSRSQRPLACEVSGGLDSSALFAVGENLRRDGQLLAPGLEGYTLQFEPDGETDDLPYARAVGEFVQRQIREIVPTTASLDTIVAQDQEDAQFLRFPNGLMGDGILDAAVSRGCRAMLVGIGGDELLAGGIDYYAEAIRKLSLVELGGYLQEDAKIVGLPRALYWLLRHGFYRILPDGAKSLLRRIVPSNWHGRGFNPDRWLSDAMLIELNHRRQRNFDLASKKLHSSSDALSAIHDPYSVWCRECEGSVASRVGIELRYPYLSRPMVEFLLKIPSRQRTRGNVRKFMHRQAMIGYLPPILTERRTKANFMKTFQPFHKEIVHRLEQRTGQFQSWIKLGEFEKVSSQNSVTAAGGWPAAMIWTLYSCMLLQEIAKENRYTVD